MGSGLLQARGPLLAGFFLRVEGNCRAAFLQALPTHWARQAALALQLLKDPASLETAGSLVGLDERLQKPLRSQAESAVAQQQLDCGVGAPQMLQGALGVQAKVSQGKQVRLSKLERALVQLCTAPRKRSPSC